MKKRRKRLKKAHVETIEFLDAYILCNGPDESLHNIPWGLIGYLYHEAPIREHAAMDTDGHIHLSFVIGDIFCDYDIDLLDARELVLRSADSFGLAIKG
jgi:hypothetical protein